MAREVIIEKLNNFLLKQKNLNEECGVVYLMVEIRKIMEHDNEAKYKLLRSFCDWTVHTKKDRGEFNSTQAKLFQCLDD